MGRGVDGAHGLHGAQPVEELPQRGRERVRVAERAAQEAAFTERSSRERVVELERRREALVVQVAQQQLLGVDRFLDLRQQSLGLLANRISAYHPMNQIFKRGIG